MTPDPAFTGDTIRIGVVMLVALIDALLWRRTVGRLPQQQPGDVAGLGRGLATIVCATGLGLVLLCGVGAWAMMGMGQ